MANTIVALYDDMDTAHKVVRDLRDMGVDNNRISLVAQDASGQSGQHVSERGDTSDGASTGAGVGAVVGGIGGLLVGLGALTIPGIGPVLAAGPLATAVSALLGAGAGAVAGSVAGGLLGALIDMGLPEEHAGYYAEGVRRGGALVTVETDDTNLDRIRDTMDRHHPVDIHQRVETWRQSGWKGYDPKAKPYTAEQMQQERQNYSSMQSSGSMGTANTRGVTGEANMGQTGQSGMRTGGVQYYPRTGSMGSQGMGSQGMGGAYGAGMSDTDLERYRQGWRGHYQSQFANTGYMYEHYEPAYQYGWTLRNEPRYRDSDWAQVEPEARRTWEQRNPGTAWDQVKAAVRYSWENFKQSVRD
jgi:uncharacterized membrane protein